MFIQSLSSIFLLQFLIRCPKWREIQFPPWNLSFEQFVFLPAATKLTCCVQVHPFVLVLWAKKVLVEHRVHILREQVALADWHRRDPNALLKIMLCTNAIRLKAKQQYNRQYPLLARVSNIGISFLFITCYSLYRLRLNVNIQYTKISYVNAILRFFDNQSLTQ